MNYRLKKSYCLLLTAVTMAISVVNPAMAAGTTVMQELESETVSQELENETIELETFGESEELLISETESRWNEAVSDGETELQTKTSLAQTTIRERTEVLSEKHTEFQNGFIDSTTSVETEFELDQFNATTKIGGNQTVSGILKSKEIEYTFIPEKSGVYELVLSGNYMLRISGIHDEYGFGVDYYIKNSDEEIVILKCEQGVKYCICMEYGAYDDVIPPEGVKYTLQTKLESSYKSFFYKLEDDYITILGYIGTESIVTIPTSIEGKSVNAIAAYAFAGCKTITEAKFPSSIESIGYHAFDNCISLKKITIPNSVKKLEWGAFYRCKLLETATIDADIDTLSDLMFAGCKKLKKVILPKTLTCIGGSAFYECSSLSEINIPESVIEIGMSAFSYCTNLKKLVLPPKLKILGGIDHCDNLDSIIIPDSVTELSGFQYCPNLKKIVLPSSTEIQGFNAFSYCTNLESVTIPQNVKFRTENTSISNPFAYCPKLKTITVDKNNQSLMVKDGMLYTKVDGNNKDYYLLTCIVGKSGTVVVREGTKDVAQDAFVGCDKITSLSIPASAYFGDDYNPWIYALDHLKRLEKIILDSRNKTVKLVNGVLYSKNGKLLLWYPKKASGKFKVPAGVTTIGYYAFKNCSKITELTLPSTVEEIRDEFDGCNSLTSIKVDSQNKIYKSVDGVLYSKDGKELYRVPAGRKGTFTIPKGVTKIDGAFTYCRKITKIVIPASVTSIANYGFINIDKLESFSVDSQNKSFSSKDGVLYDKKRKTLISCPSNIKKITIPSTVTKLGRNAFYNCSNLSKLIIPASVKELGWGAVSDCTFDVYFEGQIPSWDIYPFTGTNRPTGYYDESKPEWKAAIEHDPNFLFIEWKKIGTETTASSIKLNASTLTMAVNATSTLKATVSNASNTTITWSTSDKSVATVSSKGVVTAKSAGKATITAKCNGKSAKCTVTVNPAKPKLKKAASAEKGKIKITWEKAAGAGGYIIYKKSGNIWKKLETVKSSITSYTDKGLTSGKKYNYTVKAYKTVSGTTYTSDFDKTGVSAKVK